MSKKHFDGGCACGDVRYRVLRKPMIVHCCHCRWCQRETGSAFAINGLVESSEVETLEGSVSLVETTSESGVGQVIARCSRCHVALWSHYGAAKGAVSFLRIGTLDDPDRFPPDVHIYTASKQPWVVLPPEGAVFEGYYRRSEVWPVAALHRYKEVLGSS